MNSKERIRLRQSWTAPPTSEDLEYLDDEANHETLESDTHLDDEE